MKIIKYKRVSSGKYELELDNGEKIKLFEDIILKENLLWKKEITNLDDLLFKNSQYEIYDVAIKRLSNHVECQKGMYNYLLKKKYDEENIKKVMDKLVKNGYLNDKYYAKCYINDHINLSNDGPIKIRKHLIDNEISAKIYDEYLDIDSSIWKERINKYIEKQLKVNKKSRYYFKNKMLINLINLGYEREMINECLSSVKVDNQDELKEVARDKIRKRLEKKYTGSELEYKIKEKMYQLGFFD